MWCGHINQQASLPFLSCSTVSGRLARISRSVVTGVSNLIYIIIIIIIIIIINTWKFFKCDAG